MNNLLVTCYNKNNLLAHKLKGSENAYGIIYNNFKFKSKNCYNPSLSLIHI